MTQSEYEEFMASDPFEGLEPSAAITACRSLLDYHEGRIRRWKSATDPRWRNRNRAEVRRHERAIDHYRGRIEGLEGRATG